MHLYPAQPAAPELIPRSASGTREIRPGTAVTAQRRRGSWSATAPPQRHSKCARERPRMHTSCPRWLAGKPTQPRSRPEARALDQNRLAVLVHLLS